jgi:hypothetical protein
MAAVVKLWDRCITPLLVSVAVKLFHSFHLNSNGLGKVPAFCVRKQKSP